MHARVCSFGRGEKVDESDEFSGRGAGMAPLPPFKALASLARKLLGRNIPQHVGVLSVRDVDMRLLRDNLRYGEICVSDVAGFTIMVHHSSTKCNDSSQAGHGRLQHSSRIEFK